jgi:hypothetical protein
LKNEGHKIDVTLTPEGTILQMEKEISAKDLPKVVTTSLKKSFPKAAYKRIEEFVSVKDGKETLELYEVLLETTDKKTVEVKVHPNGKILSPDAKDGEKKEEKKESNKKAGDGAFDSRAQPIAVISSGGHSYFIVNSDKGNSAHTLLA